MLQINGKTFMNLQEAVQWLLDNNALPFQSSANYVANTEIGMGTIVNPSPAKVRIGSLIFFADSKVSTVIGLTENGFIVSDQYNDLVDDVVYVSNVEIDASAHLIVTLSNGTEIDAGLIKEVSNFSIDGSQHLIANYNDGTSTDLGSIFTGNVNIAGNFTANSIIENMVNYSFTKDGSLASNDITLVYAGVCKNGNKITFVVAGTFNHGTGDTVADNPYLGTFNIPATVGQKIYPQVSNILDSRNTNFIRANTTVVSKKYICAKASDSQIILQLNGMTSGFDDEVNYGFRIEETFLLSNNLAS